MKKIILAILTTLPNISFAVDHGFVELTKQSASVHLLLAYQHRTEGRSRRNGQCYKN